MNKNNRKPNNSLDLLIIIESIASKWIVLVLILISGGLCGLLFAYLRAPIYESSATFTVTIDYTQTGPLSDIQEDQAMRGVGSLLLSDLLIDDVVNEINENYDFSLTKGEFTNDAFIDRGDFNWTIRYRGDDPEKIYIVVQEWAGNADQMFQAALAHALSTEAYSNTIDNLQECYQKLSIQPGENYCGNKSHRTVLEEIAQLSNLIRDEREISKGLFHALAINLVNGANLPLEPIRNQLNLSVFSGAMIGFLTGVLVLVTKLLIGGEPE